MQKTRNIKWGLIVAMLILALSVCAACTRNRIAPNGNLNYGNNAQGSNVSTGTHVIEGYIVGLEGNRITIDEVEFLTTSHTARINELGLDTTRDFSDGYYVHYDGSRGRVTYPLANDVQVRFSETAANSARSGLGYTTGGVNSGVGYSTGNTIPGYTPNNTPMGVVRENALSGMAGATSRTGVGTSNTAGNGTSNTAGNAGVGTSNTLNHLGHTLGGVAGGIVGGVEMLTGRFSDGVTIDDKIPYFITIQDGYVTSIEEARAYSNFSGTETHSTTGINTHNTTGTGVTNR